MYPVPAGATAAVPEWRPANPASGVRHAFVPSSWTDHARAHVFATAARGGGHGAGPGRPAALGRSASSPPRRSAPLTNIRYGVTFDSTTARTRTLHGDDGVRRHRQRPVLLSLPAWTPGAYEMSDFASWSSASRPPPAARRSAGTSSTTTPGASQPDGARHGERGLRLSSPTRSTTRWRGRSPTSRSSTAPTSSSIPRDAALDFPATVTIKTEPDWIVATGMHRAAQRRGRYREANYHDLVDMPFFVGRFDCDSAQVAASGSASRRIPPAALTGARAPTRGTRSAG